MKNGQSIGSPRHLLHGLGSVMLVGIALSVLPWWCPTAEAASGYSRAHYILPPEALKNGVSFAGVKIPLDRKEVAERVVEQTNYLLMDRRAGMMEWFDRLAIYGPIIRTVLKDEKVPEDLIYLACLLSDLLPNAKTRTGGIGWWGLGSVKEKNAPPIIQWVSTNDWDDRRDPVLSTRIACTTLQWLYGRKETNDWLLAICAFAEGTEQVDAVVKKAPGYSDWDVVMPARSEVMIPRVVALKIIDSNRELYGVNVAPLPPLAYDFLDRLKLLKDLPLYIVAQWCQTSPRELWELNPGVNPTTGILPIPDKRSPSGFPLRVPKGMGTKVRKLLVQEGYLAG